MLRLRVPSVRLVDWLQLEALAASRVGRASSRVARSSRPGSACARRRTGSTYRFRAPARGTARGGTPGDLGRSRDRGGPGVCRPPASPRAGSESRRSQQVACQPGLGVGENGPVAQDLLDWWPSGRRPRDRRAPRTGARARSARARAAQIPRRAARPSSRDPATSAVISSSRSSAGLIGEPSSCSGVQKQREHVLAFARPRGGARRSARRSSRPRGHAAGPDERSGRAGQQSRWAWKHRQWVLGEREHLAQEVAQLLELCAPLQPEDRAQDDLERQALKPGVKLDHFPARP